MTEAPRTDHDESSAEQLKQAFEKKTDRLAVTGWISASKLKLFIDCKRVLPPEKPQPPGPEPSPPPPPPAPVTKPELLLLLEHIPKELLHEEVIDDIVVCLNDGRNVEHRRISKGRPPINGRDGKLVYMVKKYQPWTKKESLEFVDPRCLRLFDNIDKGSVVARIYPPTLGTAGIDAFGGALPPTPGKPFKPNLDPTLTLREPDRGVDFQTIVAGIAGYLLDENGKLTMRPDLILDTDIGFKTGDIDFIGSVQVKGDVLKDFRITARFDILVGGSAVNAFLKSEEGSVQVNGTAYGATLTRVSGSEAATPQTSSRTYVTSGAEFVSAKVFHAKMVQGATVEAGGDIIIEHEASGSLLNTKGALRIPNGKLIGGEVRAVGGVEVGTIGTKLMSRTVIRLCSDVESTFEYAHLLYEIEQALTAEQMLKLHLGPYAKRPERLKLLKEQFRKKLEGLQRKLVSVHGALENYNRQKTQLLSKASPSTMLRVNFQNKLHRGTVIYVGDKFFTAEKELTGPGTVEYFPDTKVFTVSDFKPLPSLEQSGSTEQEGEVKKKKS